MPEAAVRTGAVDFCLPIPEFAKELIRIGRHPFLRGGDGEKLVTFEDDSELKKVLLLVRSAIGIDFSEYKLAGIRRRLARRLALRRLTTSGSTCACCETSRPRCRRSSRTSSYM
jgi:two-component system CheB/CheR fusion protein